MDGWQQLAKYSTATIADALEGFKVRLRNEGFARGLGTMTPTRGPVLGHALTGRVKLASMTITGSAEHRYLDMIDMIGNAPAPKIVVIEDVDEQVGMGACAGVRAVAMFQALGCAGFITNGSVRNVEEIASLKFPVFATGLSPSHAYGRLVESGQPVKICGLTIHPGDMLMADGEGLIVIPPEVMPDLINAAERVYKHRTELVRYCQSQEFTRAGLRERAGQART